MSELKRLDIQYLKNIGVINNTTGRPQCAPFEATMPFPLNAEDFKTDECDCGGTFDEYERCSDCTNGHDDCEVNECFPCMERAIGRAESMSEGER